MTGISRLIRTASLQGYIELADSLDLHTDRLLAQVGLSRDMLQDPDCPLPVLAARRLLESSARALGNASFGLLLGERRRLANLGTVGIVIREEATALDAVQTLARYLQLVNPTLNLELEEVADRIVIHHGFDSGEGEQVHQSIELALAVMNGILRELIGAEWRPLAVHFSHRPPRDLGVHHRVFRCPLHFNADFSAIVCRRADLLRSRPGYDPQLTRYVQAVLEKDLAHKRSSVAATVRQLILSLLPLGRCSADEVATQLSMTSRTLNRRLAPEQASFSALLHEVRHDLAVQQLRDSDRSITHIAQLLGFESSSAFAHWFRGGFGMSARDWRQRSRQDLTSPADAAPGAAGQAGFRASPAGHYDHAPRQAAAPEKAKRP